MNFGEQIGVPCVLMRGGTSKALFFHERDIPPPGAERDFFLKRALGSPDPLQIDGLGGSRLVTSKVAIISTSTRADADVDYLFGQVDVENDLISYAANCGNISAAVGPFAVDEGLVVSTEPITTVRIYNLNTDTLLTARVEVSNGKARVRGNCVIAGVPGSGSEILIDYLDSIGAKTGHSLPTGNASESMELEDGKRIEFTLCDAGNPCVFVAAADLGLHGDEAAADISSNRKLLARAAEIQAKVGQRLGFWSDWRSQPMPGLPLLVSVAPPGAFRSPDGIFHEAATMDLRARLVFLGKCHDSFAGTGAICLAVASRILCSIVGKIVKLDMQAENLRIGHPLGVMDVKIISEAESAPLKITALGLTRTARRLMTGVIYIPDPKDHELELRDGYSGTCGPAR